MSKELSIKDLQHYPLDKLKVVCEGEVYNIDFLTNDEPFLDTIKFGQGVLDYSDIKPILRPLSDLTKEIEFEGEMIVPLYWFCENDPFFYKEYNKKYNLVQLRTDIYYNGKIRYSIWKILVNNLFDVFDLISQGLAIDINTLKE